MTVIELPDEQAEVLKAKAAAEGLSLEAWLQKLAQEERPASPPQQHIADVILKNMRDVPPEVMARMPQDGASQRASPVWNSSEGKPDALAAPNCTV